MPGLADGVDAAGRYATIVTQSDRPMMILDSLDRIVFVNPAFTRVLGYAPHEVLSRDVSVMLSAHEADMPALREFRANLGARRSFEIDLHARARDGRDLWFCSAASPVGGGAGTEGETVVVMTDETQYVALRDLRMEVMAALTGAMDFPGVMGLICRLIEDITPDVVATITVRSEDGSAWMAGRHAMPASVAMAWAGMAMGPMTGCCGAAVHMGDEILAADIGSDPRWANPLRDLVLPLGLAACWSSPIRMRDGTVAGSLALYFRTRREPALWHRRVVDACLLLCTLAMEQENARTRIARLAHYDAVTGLPNRTWLREHLQAGHDGDGWDAPTLIAVDIDRFREIGDALGAGGADAIAIGVAERLKTVIGGDDLLIRSGEDEFTVVTGPPRPTARPGRAPAADRDGVLAVDHAASLAGSILRAVARPFAVDGVSVGSTASIGICVAVGAAQPVETVLRHVQIAVSRARDAGGDTYRFFSPEMNRRAQDRIILAGALGEALSDGRLSLVYQPQIRPRDGALYGVEALARWHDPAQGDIPPARFVPLAEESGMVEALGEWALRTACRQMAEWIAAGIEVPAVAVNLSARHFRDPRLPGVIAAILAETGIPPSRLMVEMTESCMIADEARTIAAAHAIRALGVGLSMDDFGTGFSSLANLVNLPLSEVKIDRGFMGGLEQAGTAHSIVNAVIRIGQSLGVTVVAEGVETRRQLELLDDLECPVVQGYLMSRPLRAGRVPHWLAAWQCQAGP
ncbi:EAL domain-containing protein [Nguyenibacter sp. L1]|uniref:EAL domain-containing protein n=1 Tax=Nguyenibacter sp. L1 TaxID=3049350 RepID=UPI002B4A5796|nr:EAL domain-containing protein [Nguyenibacter sp. L1]WRH89402.1 EAL domain-containing protein [Nguyenibacter sp. L1]